MGYLGSISPCLKSLCGSGTGCGTGRPGLSVVCLPVCLLAHCQCQTYSRFVGFLFSFFSFALGPHPAICRDSSWFCTQESLTLHGAPGDHMECQGSNPGWLHARQTPSPLCCLSTSPPAPLKSVLLHLQGPRGPHGPVCWECSSQLLPSHHCLQPQDSLAEHGFRQGPAQQGGQTQPLQEGTSHQTQVLQAQVLQAQVLPT